jgi:hypothetical protein
MDDDLIALVAKVVLFILFFLTAGALLAHWVLWG